MHRNTSVVAMAFATAIAGSPVVAFAADTVNPNEAALGVYPYLQGVINLQFDNDWAFHSSNPDNKFNNLYMHGSTAASNSGSLRFSPSTLA